jgi:hypothetical protein
VIARNYSFSPQPGQKIDATVANVTRIIDWSTRLPQMIPLLQWFSSEHQWYDPKPVRVRHEEGNLVDEFLDWIGDGNARLDSAKRLDDDLERLRHGIRQLEIQYEKLPKSDEKGIPCGAAWNAAKNLLRLYRFEEHGRTKFSDRNLALIIDTSANCFRVEASLEKLLKESQWLNKHELSQNLTITRRAMRVIELVKNSMPAAKERSKYTLKLREPAASEKRIGKRELADVRSKLADAATPKQEQRILRDWRIHTNGNS